ncbi:radical SAM protein [Candidatus Microgenomates bacterium]|nr:radical SAM protein [Candidatus Microgenomates bacterium]
MISLKNKKNSADGSIKYLFEFSDGALAETIKFVYDNEQCVCVSTQVGCGVGCRFCASADFSFRRNLNDKEMVAEVRLALEDNPELKIFDEVAFQGTGEPLSNLTNVSLAGKTLLDQKLTKFLSLATSGNIYMFSKIRETPIKQVYLSLHATDDKTRNMLIPTNIATGVKKLISCAKKHAEDTKTKVVINYLLLDRINDTNNDLANLIKLLDPDFFRIQLIELNKVNNSKNHDLRPSHKIDLFKDELERSGYRVSILRSMGRDVEGGCGQMVSRYVNPNDV